MTNLSKDLRQRLEERYRITAPEVVRRQESSQDGTIKYLWRLEDGNCVETVLMRYRYGNSVCISSEVGCAMGCAFLRFHLGRAGAPPAAVGNAGSGAVYAAGLRPAVSHIVLMGIGEPLDNLDGVLRFLELVNSPQGMNIGMRHISLSTCGLVPRIRRLAEQKLQLTLSVSLHAPSDEIRNTLMPVNRAYPVEALLDACRDYYEATGRRISFEYAMIDRVNDSPGCARLLLQRLKGLPAHVNLIPLNEVAESPLHPSSPRRCSGFNKFYSRAGSPLRSAGPWAATLTLPADSCGESLSRARPPVRRRSIPPTAERKHAGKWGRRTA